MTAIPWGVAKGDGLVELRTEPDESAVVVLVLKADLDALTARAESATAQRVAQLESTLSEVLSRFHERGHPGRECLRTGWVNVETVAAWRAELAERRTPPALPDMTERPADLAELMALAIAWLDATDPLLDVPPADTWLQEELSRVEAWARRNPVAAAAVWPGLGVVCEVQP